MFNFIHSISANLFPRAVIATAPAFVLRDEAFDWHVEHFHDHAYRCEHDLWAAEQAAERAEIQREWDAMSSGEQAEIWDDYCDRNARGVLEDGRYFEQWMREYMKGYVGD